MAIGVPGGGPDGKVEVPRVVDTDKGALEGEINIEELFGDESKVDEDALGEVGLGEDEDRVPRSDSQPPERV